MNSKFPFSVSLIRSYFKRLQVEMDGSRVVSDIISDRGSFSFQIAITSSRISYSGAYPQSRISLERHGTSRGHPGVHLQIKYHKVDNPLGVGTLYLFLDIGSNRAMQDVAEGFLYIVYEMIGEMGQEFMRIRSELFHEELVLGLKAKKKIFLDHLSDGMASRDMEIILMDGSRTILSNDDLKDLLDVRRELIPLIGALNQNSD